MNVDLTKFYRVLAPRPAVIITTVSPEGFVNAAPYSFVTPISMDPPILAFAAAPKRHTLKNARQSGEFIVNIPGEGVLDKLYITSKAFPEGVNEIEEAGLTEAKAAKVRPPRVAECSGWIECKFREQSALGDHVLVIGDVVYAEVADGNATDGEFDISKAMPLLHVSGRHFAIPAQSVSPTVE
ncbi:MAG: flavin reductase family protein [Candidatus Aquicultorales bacterium]